MLLKKSEAEAEAERRFGVGTSRYNSFMESWRGLAEKGKYGRDKYMSSFGKSRRKDRRRV